MTDKKTEALKLALEALVKTDAEPGSKAWEREAEAITAIREALAEQPASKQRHISYVCPQCHWSLDKQPEQQQEPVAWWDPKLGVFDEKHFDYLQPLYTSPQPRQWIRLSDAEIHNMTILMGFNPEWVAEVEMVKSIVRNLEAKLKEKNT